MTLTMLRIAYLVTFLLSHLPSTQALLSGHEQSCSNEGGLVDVPFIMDPCIKCYCRNGVVKCEKFSCPNLEGCHMILFKHPNDKTCCDVCSGCVEDGVNYRDGETWKSKENPCMTKQCKAGVITTSEAICPKLLCSNPVNLEGQCCPSCPTCEMEGKTYASGDVFHPYPDTCVTCQCMDGKTSCMKEACPVLNCPASKVVHDSGACCPRCSGQRTTFLVPRMCLFQHKMYTNGKSYKVDECTDCTCVDGTMSCTRKSCPVLNCPMEDQDYPHEGSCCPVCKPKAIHVQCVHENIEHEHGSKWEFGCVECSCNNGTVTCIKPECETEQYCPLETHQLKFVDGQCCPSCVERDGLCTVFGDPHYISFDKNIFDFQGTCKYLLTKDCTDKKFAIYVKNFDRYNMPGAWTKSVTVLIGDVKIGLRKNGKVTINKSRVSLPFSKVGHFSVRYEDLNIVVEADIGLKVIWNTESYLEVHVSSSFKGKLCGMCGNFNGDISDDMVGKDGIHYKDAISFGSSWQHGRKQECSVGITQHEVQSRCQDNFSKWRRAHQECTILKSQALADCRKKIDIDSYYKSCVTDACNCPRHRSCTCDAVTAYVRECERLGIYNSKAPLNYSCSRQRRRIQQRVTKNTMYL